MTTTPAGARSCSTTPDQPKPSVASHCHAGRPGRAGLRVARGAADAIQMERRDAQLRDEPNLRPAAELLEGYQPDSDVMSRLPRISPQGATMIGCTPFPRRTCPRKPPNALRASKCLTQRHVIAHVVAGAAVVQRDVEAELNAGGPPPGRRRKGPAGVAPALLERTMQVMHWLSRRPGPHGSAPGGWGAEGSGAPPRNRAGRQRFGQCPSFRAATGRRLVGRKDSPSKAARRLRSGRQRMRARSPCKPGCATQL